MKIKPLGERIIVKPDDPMNKTPGGIIIPDKHKEVPTKGTAIKVGPGKKENGELVKMTVKEGDRLIYGKYSGTEIELDGEDYMIINESDVFATL